MSGAGEGARRPAGGAFWIGFVVVLLVAVVVTNVALLRVAAADPSVAVEPDYYRKAAAWDDATAERERSERLGWRATSVASMPAGEGGPATVAVTLVDAAGAPVAGASLDAVAFAVARSGERLAAAGRTDDAGRAALLLPRGREGLWELRLRATRGQDAFACTQRLRMSPGVAP